MLIQRRVLADSRVLVDADSEADVLADWLALVDADSDALVLADWLTCRCRLAS